MSEKCGREDWFTTRKQIKSKPVGETGPQGWQRSYQAEMQPGTTPSVQSGWTERKHQSRKNEVLYKT